jgi:hypothetical protein
LGGSFDVVVASYVLTELSGDKERRNLIKGLWGAPLPLTNVWIPDI